MVWRLLFLRFIFEGLNVCSKQSFMTQRTSLFAEILNVVRFSQHGRARTAKALEDQQLLEDVKLVACAHNATRRTAATDQNRNSCFGRNDNPLNLNWGTGEFGIQITATFS